MRPDGRDPAQFRPLAFELDAMPYAEGSVLVKCGETHVLCTATVSDAVPLHAKNRGTGWVTGEYAMLPRSSPQRVPRERTGPGGRTQEIQRLIGRSLRAVTRLEKLAGWCITIDCDVVRADGGTRCASVTGGFIALARAIAAMRAKGTLAPGTRVLTDFVAAVSVGVHNGTPILDLCYKEDSKAEVDMNLVMTGSGGFVEIQGTAEGAPFSPAHLDAMMALGRVGCERLIGEQRRLLGVERIDAI